jgi:hypothetical protein
MESFRFLKPHLDPEIAKNIVSTYQSIKVDCINLDPFDPSATDKVYYIQARLCLLSRIVHSLHAVHFSENKNNADEVPKTRKSRE